MKRQFIMGAVLVVVLAGGYFLITSNMASPTESAPVATSSSDSSIKEFSITGSNYKFTPNTLTVKKGDKVKITFKSEGGLHNFVVDDFNVKTNILEIGQEESVEFVADKIGTFEYYCSVGNHRQMGMKGTLVVE